MDILLPWVRRLVAAARIGRGTSGRAAPVARWTEEEEGGGAGRPAGVPSSPSAGPSPLESGISPRCALGDAPRRSPARPHGAWARAARPSARRGRAEGPPPRRHLDVRFGGFADATAAAPLRTVGSVIAQPTQPQEPMMSVATAAPFAADADRRMTTVGERGRAHALSRRGRPPSVAVAGRGARPGAARQQRRRQGQAPPGRVQPPPGRLAGPPLPRPRPRPPRPDPGGQRRPARRRRQLRPLPRGALRVLRELVHPPRDLPRALHPLPARAPAVPPRRRLHPRQGHRPPPGPAARPPSDGRRGRRGRRRHRAHGRGPAPLRAVARVALRAHRRARGHPPGRAGRRPVPRPRPHRRLRRGRRDRRRPVPPRAAGPPGHRAALRARRPRAAPRSPASPPTLGLSPARVRQLEVRSLLELSRCRGLRDLQEVA